MKYEIEQEDFDKLSQLDRIEYRQVSNEIDKIKPLFFDVLIGVLCLIGIGLAYGFLLIQINPSLSPEIDRFLNILRLLFMFPFLTLLADFYLMKKKSKLYEELNKKYFDTSIKTKKRK